jgi:tetratricopeptide (TPR) repeat protein
LRRASLIWALVLSGCVYFNTLYNANREYDLAQSYVRNGNVVLAKESLDSVIAKTNRVIREHPGSKYADDAAILKTRSEIQLMDLIPALNTAASRRSARGAALTVIETSGDVKMRLIAIGLLGEIEFAEGRVRMADSLLSVALDGDIDEEDRAQFYVTRGRARIALNRPREAEDDLRAAVDADIRSPEVRLDLARTLTRLGEYGEAARILADLLRDDRLAQSPQRLAALADSLVADDPDVVISTLQPVAESGLPTAPEKARLYLYIGRAWETKGVRDSALAAYDVSDEVAPNTAASLESLYYASQLRVENATTTEQVLELRSPIQRASVRRSAIMDSAASLYTDVQEFGHWVEVFESRGTTEVAALLRAAEIAADKLRAPGLARNLYIQFVETAPDSRWAPKAILGALALSGHGPDSASAGKAETDRALRRALESFPSGNPYVLASASTQSATADSAYSEAERLLQTRLDEMRRLFAPDPARVAAEDDSAAAQQVPQQQQQPGSEKEEGIEF